MWWLSLLLLSIESTRIHEFRGHMHHIQYHPKDKHTENVKELYYSEQLLNHFAPVSHQQYWAQRYFVNKQFWGGPGYPIFLYIGGEGPVTASVLTNRNFIFHQAARHRALLVAVEHRFYGKSYPTKDMSLDNLQYLSSEQALSDLARFHYYFTETWEIETSQWIAFGGSYPGSLAAWFKLKYPQLVVGSIASSAPILAQSDFASYMEVVGNGLRYFGGEKCYLAVETALQALHDLMYRIPDGRKRVDQLFTPCYPMENELDDYVFQSTIMGYFQDVAQYNELKSGITTLSKLCHQFTSGKHPLDELAIFISNARTGDCTDSKFEGVANATIDSLKIDEFDGERSSRQWFYQTCNEFGYFQTAASPRSPFHSLKAITFDHTGPLICQKVFNITSLPDTTSTNINYGALAITTENITFPSGTIDPWHVLGIQNGTHLQTSSLKSVFIQGTAHCADMQAPHENDSSEMKWAHHVIAESIAEYLDTKSTFTAIA